MITSPGRSDAGAAYLAWSAWTREPKYEQPRSMPRTAVRIELTMAKTNEPTIAVSPLEMLTPGVSRAASRNAANWSTKTATPVAISDTDTSMARMTGRMTALKIEMSATASTAAPSESTVMPGSSQAVTANEIVLTATVTIARRRRDIGPPRPAHITRSWGA